MKETGSFTAYVTQPLVGVVKIHLIHSDGEEKKGKSN